MSTTTVTSTTAPPTVVGPSTFRATRPTNKLPQYFIDESYTMKDIGLEGQGISPTAVTTPFQLFTEEAIGRMRAEIFRMGPARAPFTCDAWNSPEVLEKFQRYAAINVSVDNHTTGLVKESESNDDNLPAFAWHRDSYPFVCVTMLSDCSGMTGGETALKTATGEIMKVRGPAMGTAVVMQGRYIEHQALKAFGGRERISMVNSFRAKLSLVRDVTVLTGVRSTSNLSELYTEYSEYRLKALKERVWARLEKERQRQLTRRPFNIDDMKVFLTE
ncbi:uncharacterized protein BDW43DRAFT_321071 [Aspergillus alliaceus]|uniref:uncharacterized protein n=1 Tax=Petromyces alliaceus TaxID=209559 RepID=UPI0012A4F919|nr:uncharacterized protein BDW43DRAFT_321071 [Aspergillus alliaceus]KAB8230847.1 hypothetical protein BDW43DRAFT_321071 [Aspergillus alliaceus]